MPTWPSPAQGPLFYDPSICDACMSSLHFVGGGTGWLVPRFGTQPSDDRARSVGTCKSSRISLWGISSVRLKSWNDTILSQFRYITRFFFFLSQDDARTFSRHRIFFQPAVSQLHLLSSKHTQYNLELEIWSLEEPQKEICVYLSKKKIINSAKCCFSPSRNRVMVSFIMAYQIVLCAKRLAEADVLTNQYITVTDIKRTILKPNNRRDSIWVCN